MKRSSETSHALLRVPHSDREAVDLNDPGYCYLILFPSNERRQVACMLGHYPYWSDVKSVGGFVRRSYNFRRGSDNVVHLTTQGIGYYPENLKLREDDMIGGITHHNWPKTITDGIVGSMIFGFTWYKNRDTVIRLFIIIALYYAMLGIKYIVTKLIELLKIPLASFCNLVWVVVFHMSLVGCLAESISVPDSDTFKLDDMATKKSELNGDMEKEKHVKTEIFENAQNTKEKVSKDVLNLVRTAANGDIEFTVHCEEQEKGFMKELQSQFIVPKKSKCDISYLYENHMKCFDKGSELCCKNVTMAAIIESYSHEKWYNSYITYTCPYKKEEDEKVSYETYGQWVDAWLDKAEEVYVDTKLKVKETADKVYSEGVKENFVVNQLISEKYDDFIGSEFYTKSRKRVDQAKESTGKFLYKYSENVVTAPDTIDKIVTKVTERAKEIYNEEENFKEAASIDEVVKGMSTLSADVVGTTAEAYNIMKDTIKSIKDVGVSNSKIVTYHLEADVKKESKNERKGVVGVLNYLIDPMLGYLVRGYNATPFINEETLNKTILAVEIAYSPISYLNRRVTVEASDRVYHLLNSITSGIGLTRKTSYKSEGETQGNHLNVEESMEVLKWLCLIVCILVSGLALRCARVF